MGRRQWRARCFWRGMAVTKKRFVGLWKNGFTLTFLYLWISFVQVTNLTAALATVLFLPFLPFWKAATMKVRYVWRFLWVGMLTPWLVLPEGLPKLITAGFPKNGESSAIAVWTAGCVKWRMNFAGAIVRNCFLENKRKTDHPETHNRSWDGLLLFIIQLSPHSIVLETENGWMVPGLGKLKLDAVAVVGLVAYHS